MLLSSFAIIIIKQLTLSVTKPFDSSPCALLSHESLLHRYGDMKIQTLDAQMHRQKQTDLKRQSYRVLHDPANVHEH